MKKKLMSGPKMVPHIKLVGGMWRLFWRDTWTGVQYFPHEVSFMTRSTTRGNKAAAFCSTRNARIAAGQPWTAWPPVQFGFNCAGKVVQR